MKPLAAINEFPGVTRVGAMSFQWLAQLPARCPDDGGPLVMDETGCHCATCRTHYVVEEVLTATLRDGRAPMAEARACHLGAALARRHARVSRPHGGAP